MHTQNNITRKKLLEEISAAEKHFRRLIEHSADAIALLAEDGLILYQSPSVNHILGYTAEDLVGQNALDYLHPEDANEATLNFIQFLRNPKDSITIQARLRHQDSSWRWLQAVITNVPHEPSGQTLVVNYHDITEQIQAQERLTQERFIAMVAHDFRTPLAIIQASAELIGHHFDQLSPEKRMKIADKIQSQITYMTGLMDDLMVVNRAQTGKLEFRPKVLDLEPICRNIFDQCQFSDPVGHQYTFSAEGDLANVRMDEYLLRRILVNLLSNAIKYSPFGGEVRFDVSRSDQEIVFQISDQGIGIPEQDQDHVFDTFHRAKNTRNIQGTGLGLAIVKSSVETHRGSITFSSKENEGTTFQVRLPAGS